MIGKCNTGGENVKAEVTAQVPIIQGIADNFGVEITTPSGSNKEILRGNNVNLQNIKQNAKALKFPEGGEGVFYPKPEEGQKPVPMKVVGVGTGKYPPPSTLWEVFKNSLGSNVNQTIKHINADGKGALLYYYYYLAPTLVKADGTSQELKTSYSNAYDVYGSCFDDNGNIYLSRYDSAGSKSDFGIEKCSSSGSKIWKTSFALPACLLSYSPDTGLVYAIGGNKITAISPSNGQQVWSLTLSSAARRYIKFPICINMTGVLKLYEDGSGEEWSWSSPTRIYAADIDSEGYSYLWCGGKKLRKVSPIGELVWEYTDNDMTGATGCIAVDSKGFIYYITHGGKCLKTINQALKEVSRITEHNFTMPRIAVDDDYIYISKYFNEVSILSKITNGKPSGVAYFEPM